MKAKKQARGQETPDSRGLVWWTRVGMTQAQEKKRRYQIEAIKQMIFTQHAGVDERDASQTAAASWLAPSMGETLLERDIGKAIDLAYNDPSVPLAFDKQAALAIDEEQQRLLGNHLIPCQEQACAHLQKVENDAMYYGGGRRLALLTTEEGRELFNLQMRHALHGWYKTSKIDATCER